MSENFLRTFTSGQVPEWKVHYIDFKQLEIAKNSIQNNSTKAESQYTNLLDTEISKCNAFYEQLIKENTPNNSNVTQQSPEKLSECIQKIDKFALQNVTALKETVKNHDAISLYPIKSAYYEKIHRKGFCESSLIEKIFLQLSHQYHLSDEKQSFPKESSEKITLKYWIQSPHIAKVVCDILPNLPMCLPDSTEVNLIYFDNDKMEYYSRSLDKKVHDFLIRMRYFDKLTSNTDVYIEQHSAHTDTFDSISEDMHCIIPQSQVIDYVHGKTNVSQDYLEKYPVYSKIQKIIQEKKLCPRMKTSYASLNFQKPEDSSLRISIHRRIKMLREVDKKDLKRLASWNTPNMHFNEQSIHYFPYDVLTIQLTTLADKPEWLSALTENRRMLIPQDNFKKYWHGVAVLYPEEIKEKPMWFDDRHYGSQFQSVQHQFQVISPSDDSAGHLHSDGTKLLSLSEPPPVEKKKSVPIVLNLNNRKAKGDDDGSSIEMKDMSKNKEIGKVEKNKESIDVYEECRRLCCKKKDPSIRRSLKIEPKTFFANERTFLQWFSAGMWISSVGLGLIGLNDGRSFFGYFLVPGAIILLIYALAMYHRRILQLKKQMPTSSYMDTWGPSLLIMALTISFIIIVFGQPNIPLTSQEICPIREYETLDNIEISNTSGLVFNPNNDYVYGNGENDIFIMKLVHSVGRSTKFQTVDYFIPLEYGNDDIPKKYFGFTDITINKTGNGMLYVGSNHRLQPKILQINPSSHEITNVFILFYQVSVSGLTYVKKNDEELFYVSDPSDGKVYIYKFTNLLLVFEESFIPFEGSTSITSSNMQTSFGLVSISYFENIIAYNYLLEGGVRTIVFYQLDGDDYQGKFKHVLNANNLEAGANSICFSPPYGYDEGKEDGFATALAYSSVHDRLTQYFVWTAANPPRLVTSCTL